MVLAVVFTPDVLGEVVERAGRKDGERASRLHRYCGSARHGSVATADAEHLGALGRGAEHLLEVVVPREFDDLGFRQFPSDFADDAGTGPAAGCGVDDQDHARALGSGRRIDAERVGWREVVLDDRRDQARAQHGDRRADAEAREDVAGVVGAGRDAR